MTRRADPGLDKAAEDSRFLVAAAKAAKENAISHWYASSLLFERGNYPLALAILILAYEEFGKAMWLRLDADRPGLPDGAESRRNKTPPLLDHTLKQNVVTSTMLHVTVTAVVTQAIEKHVSRPLSRDETNTIVEAVVRRDLTKVNWSRYVTSAQAAASLAKEINQGLDDVKWLSHLLRRMNEVKKNGFYVDVDVGKKRIQFPENSCKSGDYVRLRGLFELFAEKYQRGVDRGFVFDRDPSTS